MEYQVLARKWRPKKFEDVVGQTHITRSLQNAIMRNQVGHAYLFTGTRGIGKTSVARIFAKALQCPERSLDNGNPCLNCHSCREIDADKSLDVLEIDGASHNGVDNIRQLVENVQYLPTSGMKRIYIIDEVHMLTKEAFNALLKTLEEPPSHVVFLFATTHPGKLLETVLSRCQRFDFRNVSTQEMTDYLGQVALKEGIRPQGDSLLKTIAMEAKGSMRDALSLLDQVLSFSTDRLITEEGIALSLGLAKTSAVRAIVTAIIMGRPQDCSQVYRQTLRENADLEKLLLAILGQLAQIIDSRLSSAGGTHEILEALPRQVLERATMAEIFWIYECLVKDVQWSLKSLDPEKVTEIVLQKICYRGEFFQGHQALPDGAGPLANPSPSSPPTPPTAPPTAAPVSAAQEEAAPLSLSWEDFLQHVRKGNPALAAHLEQGNILRPVERDRAGLKVDVRFKEEGNIFLEYLNDREVNERIRNFLAEFYAVAVDQVHLTLGTIESKMVEQENFRTLAEIERTLKEGQTLKKREELLSHPMIRKAQDLFQAKVDRVIINES